MKNFIIFIAFLLVLMPYLVFMDDTGKVSVTSTTMKNDAERIVKGASMLFDADYYKEGYYVFNDTDVLDYLNDEIGDKYKYTVYIYDQSDILRTYDNYEDTTKLTEQKEVTLKDGEYKMEDRTGYETKITDPCVILVIEKEGKTYRIPLTENKYVRSSMYTIDTRST